MIFASLGITALIVIGVVAWAIIHLDSCYLSLRKRIDDLEPQPARVWVNSGRLVRKGNAWDVFADEDCCVLWPGSTAVIKTGVHLNLQSGVFGVVMDIPGSFTTTRSSVISDGELQIVLANESVRDTHVIKKGDRIAQIVFFKRDNVEVRV